MQIKDQAKILIMFSLNYHPIHDYKSRSEHVLEKRILSCPSRKVRQTYRHGSLGLIAKRDL